MPPRPPTQCRQPITIFSLLAKYRRELLIGSRTHLSSLLQCRYSTWKSEQEETPQQEGTRKPKREKIIHQRKFQGWTRGTVISRDPANTVLLLQELRTISQLIEAERGGVAFGY